MDFPLLRQLIFGIDRVKIIGICLKLLEWINVSTKTNEIHM